MQAKTWLAYLVSLGLIAALVVLVDRYVGFAELLAPWRLVSPVVALGGLAVLLASYVVRTLRFYYYFHDRMAERFALCTKLTWYHNFFNYMLPMRTGEIAFPILMARYFAIPVATSVPVLVWFRILDLHALMLGAILALPLLDVPLVAALALAAVWLALPWYGYRFHRDLAARLRRSGRWTRLAEALAALPQDDARFLSAWGWTLANWAAKLFVVTLGIVVFARSPYVLSLAAAVAGEISMVLPIHSVAAAGTYDAAVSAVLAAGGAPLEVALAGAVNLHLFLVAGVLLTGTIALLIPAQRAEPERGRAS